MKQSTFYSIGIAFLLLLVSGALYAGVYYLLEQETLKAADLEKEMRSKHTEIARAAKAQSATATLGEDEARIASYSLPHEEIVSFLESVQAEGKPLGSSVQVLSVSDEKSGGHPRVTLSLLITGSFDSVMKTIGVFENAPYDSALTNFTLDSGTTDPKAKGPKQWSAATTLSVGVHKQAPTTP